MGQATRPARISRAPGFSYLYQTGDVSAPELILDLPQLYTRPSEAELLEGLALLAVRPRDFTTDAATHDAPQVNPAGVTQYLTAIVSSSLSWLTDEAREAVWETASARLSERSGRTGMADITRTFTVPLMGDKTVDLTLREPTLTADNLGNKTWVSSFLLSQRLKSLLPPQPSLAARATHQRARALELGAGTGLVGLAFAMLRGEAASVHLTDLDIIVPNIKHNVNLNHDLLESVNAEVTTGVLDWSLADTGTASETRQYDIILAADPLYSPDHPQWLVQTIHRWLKPNQGARVFVEMPLRTPYLPQVEDFKARMDSIGLKALMEGEEIGFDDWYGQDGQPLEVRCWWSVWCWKSCNNCTSA
ncbi:hypothetical protein KEM54_004861 [Ascosphaera aggregata]|nr:hypothetical protein KEM54_004861 [Ascosphaera aggregata]